MKVAISGTEEKYSNVSVRLLLDDARRLGVHWIELWHPKNTVVEGLDLSLELIEQSGIQVAAVAWGARCTSPIPVSGC